MSWFKLRPTFEYALPEPPQGYLDKLNTEFKRVGDTTLFIMHNEYGEFHLPKDQHRLWSPHLSFYLEAHENSTTLHGRFAPRVEIWTSVWIFYLAMSFTAFFAFTLAFTQWMLNLNCWGMWIGLLAIALIGLLYVIAHVGQQWSVDQMHLLQERLNTILHS